MQATQTETLADRINRTTNGMLTIMQALRPLLKTYFALLKNPLWAALQTQPNDDDPFFECSPQYLHRVTGIALSYVYAQLDKLEAFGLVQYRMWEQYRLYRINEVAVTNIESFCKLVSMDKDVGMVPVRPASIRDLGSPKRRRHDRQADRRNVRTCAAYRVDEPFVSAQGRTCRIPARQNAHHSMGIARVETRIGPFAFLAPFVEIPERTG
jgi:hypothetical protein